MLDCKEMHEETKSSDSRLLKWINSNWYELSLFLWLGIKRWHTYAVRDCGKAFDSIDAKYVFIEIWPDVKWNFVNQILLQLHLYLFTNPIQFHYIQTQFLSLLEGCLFKALS